MGRAIPLVVVVVSVAWAGAALAAPARPSKSRCAVAWNTTAPGSLRSAIVGRHPHGAFVSAGVSVYGITLGKSATLSDSTGCGIQFILPGGRVLAVWGALKGGRVATWSGPVASKRAISVPDNASVRADASVGFHG